MPALKITPLKKSNCLWQAGIKTTNYLHLPHKIVLYGLSYREGHDGRS